MAIGLSETAAMEVRVQLARARLSAAELARRWGKSQAYVSRRVNGDVALDLTDIEAIAQILRIPAAKLLPPRSMLDRVAERVALPVERVAS